MSKKKLLIIVKGNKCKLRNLLNYQYYDHRDSIDRWDRLVYGFFNILETIYRIKLILILKKTYINLILYLF